MDRNKKLLLIYSDIEPITISQTVDIMLSPQFYTLKKEAIPVKYAYQAKKIAPSLFDGLLDNPLESDYFVYKEDDLWVFIAYNLNEIQIFLQSKNIAIEKVAKLFFAQQAVKSFDTPVVLGKSDTLSVMDNTVVVFPQAALPPHTKVAKHLTLKGYPTLGIKASTTKSEVLNKSQALTIGAIFALFAGMYAVEGSRYTNNEDSSNQELSNILEDNPSFESTIQRKSIATKYKTIDTQERKKRDVIKLSSDLIFKGVILDVLDINEKKFKVIFSCDANKTVKDLHELIKKQKAIQTQVKLEGTKLTMEGTI